ncbi:hypothetical protein OG426_51260 [Streptomyces canus]|nr:hypothetical protein [Streptomyces canus]MCX4854344.1 hypothetical protein [Streptomyces canus]WSW40208.1 hypothetical protein OG426_51260 [Streptomyces canus]
MGPLGLPDLAGGADPAVAAEKAGEVHAQVTGALAGERVPDCRT